MPALPRGVLRAGVKVAAVEWCWVFGLRLLQ